jgi:hypothetical protein
LGAALFAFIPTPGAFMQVPSRLNANQVCWRDHFISYPQLELEFCLFFKLQAFQSSSSLSHRYTVVHPRVDF